MSANFSYMYIRLPFLVLVWYSKIEVLWDISVIKDPKITGLVV